MSDVQDGSVRVHVGTWRESADVCLENGWQVGDVLEGTESAAGWSCTTRILITAIGERSILARDVWQNGEARDGLEAMWTLNCRDWRKVSP